MESIRTLIFNMLRYYQNKERHQKARKTKKSFHTLNTTYNTHNGNFETLCREKWIVLKCRLNRQDIVVIFSLLRCLYYKDFDIFENFERGFDFLDTHEDYSAIFPKNEELSVEETRNREDKFLQKLTLELSSHDDIPGWIKWIKMMNTEYETEIKYHEDVPHVLLHGLVEQTVYDIETIIQLI